MPRDNYSQVHSIIYNLLNTFTTDLPKVSKMFTPSPDEETYSLLWDVSNHEFFPFPSEVAQILLYYDDALQ